MSDNDDRILKLLKRGNELLTILAKGALSDVLRKETANAKSRALYQLTQGDLPVTAISKRVGLSVGTISRTWQRWEEQGLLIKDGKRYRRALD